MTVLDFATLMRRGWLMLVAGVLVGVLGGVAYFMLTPKVYTASATGFIASSGDALVSGADEASARAASYVSLISSGTVRDAIASELGEEPGSLQGNLSARVVPGSTLIEVTAQSQSPEQAVKLASGALDGLVAVIDEIESQGGQTARITVVPLDDAVQPSTPSTPQLRPALLVGALAGLVGGVVVLLVRRVLDVRVRVHTDMTDLMGTGVLGRVPKFSAKGRSKNGAQASTIAQEAYRQIRTGLRFSSVDTEVRVVVVTSANQGEGKSSTAASLAKVTAESGQRTIIIDADLRRPKVARNFGIDGSVGLSGVLSGQVDAAAAIRAMKEPNLFVLPAGAIPPNPSEMLGSAALRTLLAELRREFFVIIDAPPVLPVTDASVVSTMADGVVFVVHTGSTRKAAAAAARQQLEQVGARLLGVVLNFVSLKEEGYGYGYGQYRQNRSYYLAAQDVESKAKAARRAKRGEAAAKPAASDAAPALRRTTRA
ncbi:polysaccharide biosynthesis tyrosine autokinase [Microbacterium esteraromaticum]|uniref:polysaccharide biosynthesis tyrosine autokinase n=1 Tax=Microbacterium esteraromaticum TaxID=57043 RepID=UPI002367DB13|nr:polysaccharide biosynthesis tyrosine autokinase [Microbacterium esteraromaticum]WDH79444.1 polysaccharide biosynthesis tyrosine autokinase [Microbacterium esteraromaticum]